VGFAALSPPCALTDDKAIYEVDVVAVLPPV
jgi:hypothetical protein